MTQYSIRPKRSAIRAQAVYFLHSTIPDVTCLRLSDVSVICRVTYFHFPIQSAFLPYIGRQAASTLRRTIGFNMQIKHRTVPKIWVGKFPVPKAFTASPLDVVVFKCRKICPTGSQ